MELKMLKKIIITLIVIISSFLVYQYYDTILDVCYDQSVDVTLEPFISKEIANKVIVSHHIRYGYTSYLLIAKDGSVCEVRYDQYELAVVGSMYEAQWKINKE